MPAERSTLSIVLPVHDEADGVVQALEAIWAAAAQVPAVHWEFVVVDDGSRDATVDRVRALDLGEAALRLVVLTRNFGKEAAILAGLEQAVGEAVIVMDADLQHPPELIPKMVSLWRAGALVVEGVKSDRGEEGQVSGAGARLFYALFSWLSGLDVSNASDFKLLDREVVDQYCRLPERNRFFRGLIPWLGFTSARIPFAVPPRPRGVSSWSRWRLLRFALSALTAFSSMPLHLITALGVFVFIVSAVFGGIALYQKFTGLAVSGFTTVILLQLLIGSVLMVSLGILGAYLGRVFEEAKGRPSYVVDRRRSRL